MLDGVSLDQLRTFITAVDEGSFSAAARKLNRVHFGLIDNAAESYTAPVNELAVARNVHGIAEGDFVAPHIGQIFRY